MAENAASRLASYKNHSKNSQEMRMKRHEVTVELRKSKKEDQMFKRRNIDIEEALSPLQENNGQSPITMKMEEIMEGMQSTDSKRQFSATQAARKVLSRERNPPIDTMIGLGIVPICVRFLENFDDSDLQFEAAWALTNLASGTSQQTKTVVDADAVPRLVPLLLSQNLNVAEQSVWALGNIAGDGPYLRDVVLEHDIVSSLMQLVQNNIPISFLQNIVWLMSNLCRNKNPPPSFERIKPMLEVFAHLLNHNDSQVLADVCWALSYVTDDENHKIQAVIDAGSLPALVNLLSLESATIITPALRSVGNIVTGSDTQTDAVINAGALPHLAKLLQNNKSSIVKEAAWTVSNIAAGNRAQIQELIDQGIFLHIINVLQTGDFRAQKEAAWAITNTTTGGTSDQIVHLLENNLMKPYCDLLDAKDAKTVKVILTGIQNIFQLIEQIGGADNLCILIEEVGGLDKLESLQSHENEEIYRIAFAIVDKYFIDAEAEQPNEANGGLEFNANEPNAANGNGFAF